MERKDAPGFITGRLHDQLHYANISIIKVTSKMVDFSIEKYIIFVSAIPHFFEF
jgi:hypothetical protein